MSQYLLSIETTPCSSPRVLLLVCHVVQSAAAAYLHDIERLHKCLQEFSAYFLKQPLRISFAGDNFAFLLHVKLSDCSVDIEHETN